MFALGALKSYSRLLYVPVIWSSGVVASIIAGKPIRKLGDEDRFPDGSLHARRFASCRNFWKAIPAASHSPHETPPQNPYHRLRFIVIS
jgi:hypothetical protein